MGRRLLLMAGENLIFNINEKSPRAPFVVRGCVLHQAGSVVLPSLPRQTKGS